MPRVLRYSVIVPAFNAAASIGICIEALLRQSASTDDYEVLVVDDGSTDGTVEVARRYPVKVICQEHTGPACARNNGARAAQGEFLLFTDADCIPTPSWIEEIVRPFEDNSEVSGVKGTYRTDQRNLIARFAQVELEEKYAWMRRRRYIDFIDTYSAAFRKEIFWEGGAFDPQFPVASNEDTLLSFNLAAKGRKLLFAERAVVSHHHPVSLRHYLVRKWRHGFWRVPVFQRHPGKMAGDSYTPRSTQLQVLAVALGLAFAPIPQLQMISLAMAFIFLVATLPFIRRATSVSWKVTAVVPFILLLRAIALGCGLATGLMVVRFAKRRQTYPKGQVQVPDCEG